MLDAEASKVIPPKGRILLTGAGRHLVVIAPRRMTHKEKIPGVPSETQHEPMSEVKSEAKSESSEEKKESDAEDKKEEDKEEKKEEKKEERKSESKEEQKKPTDDDGKIFRLMEK